MLTKWVLLLAAPLLLTSCSSIGPDTVPRDRFNYVTAISDSWKRQTLLNLVKLRYADAPVFMDVASVISSYEVTEQIDLGAQVSDRFRGALQGDQYLSLGGTGRYVDRPTISYQPLSGEKFAKSLMTPLPVSSVMFLIQSGYPADLMLRVCLDSINGIDNSYSGPGNPREGSPRFRDLMAAIRQAQAVGGFGLRLKPIKDRQPVVLSLRAAAGEAAAGPDRRIRELLSLDPKASEFTLTYGDFPDSDKEISVLSRSILQIMIDVSSAIDVPAKDVQEGRVYIPQRSAEQAGLFPPLIRVQTGAKPPVDVFVSVPYRGQWFWIEDRDRPSKQMLTMLMMLFSLTETAAAQAAPLLTVPTR